MSQLDAGEEVAAPPSVGWARRGIGSLPLLVLLVATGCAAIEPRTDPLVSWEKVKQWYATAAPPRASGGRSPYMQQKRRGDTDFDYYKRHWGDPPS